MYKDDETRKSLRTELIAAACHSAWYAYTVIGLGEEGEPWETAPDWQKDSIRDAVEFWDELQPHLSVMEICVASHRNWCRHKIENDWVYGTVKDPEKKIHPCLVPYYELPEAQRKKDEVVVRAYLALRSVLDD